MLSITAEFRFEAQRQRLRFIEPNAFKTGKPTSKKSALR
jgi:hypothetical protein